MKLRTLLLFVALAVTTAACGSATTDTTTESTAQEAVQDITDSLEESQAASGGGSATLTVGDQSWSFSPLLCSFDDGDVEFVVSSIQDGVQLYATIDSFGHAASLNDIEDFENPSVSLDSTGPYTEIVLNGKDFVATGEFLDDTTESFERTPGTVTGSCP